MDKSLDGEFQQIEWQSILDAMLFTEQESSLVSDAHCRARPKVEAIIARLQNGAPVDGEAGDLWDADSERQDFDAWIKATACKAHWTRRHIAWLAWIERAGRAARLSPAPKQGRPEVIASADMPPGTIGIIQDGKLTAAITNLAGGATGGEAGNAGDHAAR